MAAGAGPGPGPGYRVTGRLHLGGSGGWDCLIADSAARRLYVSRGSHVAVLDLDTRKTIGDIPDTLGVHGIALAPEFGRGFTSNGGANTATIFDLKTLQRIGEVSTGKNPDAIVYDPASKLVFTFNGRSGDATAFRAADGKIAATIPLGGKPEFARADGHGKIYVNIEDRSETAEIDTSKLALVRRFSLKPCEEPSGMGIDAARHRLFVGCHNQIMAVVDTDAGKVIGTVPIGAGVDANEFDPASGLAFSSNGDGTLTVARETEPGKFEAVQTVLTAHGARTMAIDTKTGIVYLPTAQFGPPPRPTADVPHPRPSIVPDSFEILIAEKD